VTSHGIPREKYGSLLQQWCIPNLSSSCGSLENSCLPTENPWKVIANQSYSRKEIGGVICCIHLWQCRYHVSVYLTLAAWCQQQLDPEGKEIERWNYNRSRVSQWKKDEVSHK
jgi:hypothetical protein